MLDGFLGKLKILPFSESENVQAALPSGPPFIAQFNPETFSVTNELEYAQEDPAHGDDGEEAKFKCIKPKQYSFDFLLDGTGATGEKKEVLAQIELFKATVGFFGPIHRPRFLMLSWGTFVANCVLESYTINYKLFRPDGTPLRAVISATFKEHKPKLLKELLKNLGSPDLTRSHDVKEKEQLWLVSYKEYESTNYYIHVAEKNGLDNIRRLKNGKRLYFPPLEQ
ncbi:hypothetical protein OO013_08345 [Mangrovivirga sp. M17]|uniref:Contractile injection system tube protein N-terminal domain-containing protein n=1 Tax=Mangrovivirga halotolerans TaxID=2993936 RepID=A0ABT3RRH2_9BACT|nr:hypothetical protein [Mangrovivirga halotolerans]MCX2743872.1 hypothetical protein [Mangrovivirga halotolerans]